MRPQVDHLGTTSNWLPFTAAELPAPLVHELEGILRPLYIATLELHRTVYRYELLQALGRDWSFVRKVDGTTAAPALNTVKGCINTTLVTSLCAFFDENQGAVNLRTILNLVVRPSFLASFREFHTQTKPGFDTDWQRDRLVRLQRRLNRGETGKALARLNALRNQKVAHLDIDPSFADGWPIGHDMTIVLAATANIVISLVRFAIAGRRVRPLLGRQDARDQARALCRAIHPSVIGRRGSAKLL